MSCGWLSGEGTTGGWVRGNEASGGRVGRTTLLAYAWRWLPAARSERCGALDSIVCYRYVQSVLRTSEFIDAISCALLCAVLSSLVKNHGAMTFLVEGGGLLYTCFFWMGSFFLGGGLIASWLLLRSIPGRILALFFFPPAGRTARPAACRLLAGSQSSHQMPLSLQGSTWRRETLLQY
jgi:hypothetical protein